MESKASEIYQEGFNNGRRQGVKDAKSTLLDDFAGLAMQGLLASPGALNGLREKSGKDIAAAAYGLGQEMLLARELANKGIQNGSQ